LLIRYVEEETTMNTLRIAVIATGLIACVLAVKAAGAADAPAPPAVAATPNTPLPEASIPFARRNIFNWVADGEKGIWVQAIGRQWYYGTFLSPCYGLPFREGVAFRFGPSGELDKWGAVIVRRSPVCVFRSFTASDGPPQAKKKTKPPAATTPPPTPAPPAGPAS
jgi:hypothetical protein